MSNDFGIKRLADVVPTNETPFLIEGLIHRTATMIYGRPKAGKSFVALSAAMALSEGTPWLGRKVEQKNTLFWTLDPGQEDETWQRFNTANGKKDSRLFVTDIKPEDTDEWWAEFADVLFSSGIEVLFVDNLSALLGKGSYNSDADTRPAMGRLQALVDEGIPVILVHHSAKFSEDQGNYQQSPMGCTPIEAWARHFIQVIKDEELRVLRVYGNNTSEREMGVAINFNGEGDDGAFMTLIGEEETIEVSASHEDLVARAKARWESRKDRAKKQGRSPRQRANAPERSRGSDHASQIGSLLAGTPSKWFKFGEIQQAVKGNPGVIQSAAASLVSNGQAEFRQEGRSKLYRHKS